MKSESILTMPHNIATESKSIQHLVYDENRVKTNLRPQWGNGKAVIKAYQRQAANMSISEQYDYKRLIQKGSYCINESASTKPSNHALDRLIKAKPCWAKYVMLHALYPTKMESIDKSVRRSLGELVVNDYSALYKEASKNFPTRPSMDEIHASRVETHQAKMAARIAHNPERPFGSWRFAPRPQSTPNEEVADVTDDDTMYSPQATIMTTLNALVATAWTQPSEWKSAPDGDQIRNMHSR